MCGSQVHDNVKGSRIYHIAPFCIIPFVSQPFLAFILHLVIPSHSHPCSSIFFRPTSAIPSCCHPDVPLLKPDVHDFPMPMTDVCNSTRPVLHSFPFVFPFRGTSPCVSNGIKSTPLTTVFMLATSKYLSNYHAPEKRTIQQGSNSISISDVQIEITIKPEATIFKSLQQPTNYFIPDE